MSKYEFKVNENIISPNETKISLIQHVFFSGFNIEKGNTLIHQYPCFAEEYHDISDFMLPDGLHETGEDWNFFILNRPLIHQLPSYKLSIGGGYFDSFYETFSLPDNFTVKLYRMYDEDWIGFNDEVTLVFVKIEGDKISFHAKEDDHLYISLDFFKFLLTQQSSNFFTFEFDSLELGIEFFTLYDVDTFMGMYYSKYEQHHGESSSWLIKSDLNTCCPPLYCISCAVALKDDTQKRGMLARGIAFAGLSPAVISLKEHLPILLKEILSLKEEEQLNKIKEIYSNYQQIEISNHLFPDLHSLKLMKPQTSPILIPKELQNPLNFVLPNSLLADELPSSLVFFDATRFNSFQLSQIFTGLFVSARILLVGNTATEVVEAILGLINWMTPLRGILASRAFPCQPISTDNVMLVPGAIVGSTNPVLESFFEWDLVINYSNASVNIVATSSISWIFDSSLPFYESDQKMFNKLLNFDKTESNQNRTNKLISNYCEKLIQICLFRNDLWSVDSSIFQKHYQRILLFMASDMGRIACRDFFCHLAEIRWEIRKSCFYLLKNENILESLTILCDNLKNYKDFLHFKALMELKLNFEDILMLSLHKDTNVQQKLKNLVSVLETSDIFKDDVAKLNFTLKLALFE
eukprot:TRINITY_DN4721_c0_g1_i1.p1 TRINITY_DN4721_c0_g1~~TRINITY_DN4721_c0_g1_i1.p1  ORF type:complete len:636 (+),score=139.58 TRINITY_DN4721_c0_g1_i1:44-1951(+)